MRFIVLYQPIIMINFFKKKENKKISKNTLSALLIFVYFFLPVTSVRSAQFINENNIVDSLWEAKRDSNVVDTFKTIRETLDELEKERLEWRARNQNFLQKEFNKKIEYLGYSENSSGSVSQKNDYTKEPIYISSLNITNELNILPNLHKKNKNKIEVLTEHRHPKEGEEWIVRFRTQEAGKLSIIPADQNTVDEDEFIGLWCGDKKINAKILEKDKIEVDNWNCDDIATVSHKTLKEGKHLLHISLDEKTASAHNGPNTRRVMGSFKDGVTTGTFAGNASINVRQPDPAPGDLMVAVIALRPQTDIVTTPSGWTSLGSISGTDGAAEGIDTGSARLYTMYKVATGSEGTTNQTFAETGTPSVWGVKIFKFRSSTGTYDIATTSYSINADTTAFGSTLPNTDTGFQSGDVALIAATQNGDLATYSGWNITATGASFGTVSEVLDSNSTTGNDVRFGAAMSYVTSGTAHATPATTITLSAAASGAVSVLRIRQGDGPNRNDTFLRSCGLTAAGGTSVAPVYPENEPGDLLLLIVGTRNSTVSPSTPANWTNIANYTGGVGTFGSDAGNAKVQAFYRVPTTVLTGTQSVTITSGNTSAGQICAIHRDGVYNWSIDNDGGSDNTAGTAWSVTGGGIDFTSNDGGNVVIVGNAINTDAYTYSAHALSATAMTISDFNETTRLISGTGNDMALNVVSGEVTAGSSMGVVPTYTMTSSGSGTNAPAGASIILAVHGNLKPYDGRRVRLISNKIKLNEGGKLKINQQ